MNKSKPYYTILIACVILISGCKISYDDISLGDCINETGEISGFPENDYGYIIYDIELQKPVKSHNTYKEFIPASVTKLFTSLFAREILGDDYSFTTKLSYTGNIVNGLLKGDLYLTGSGDPELSIEGLVFLVEGLKLKKIKEITGNFFFDETIFTPREMLDESMPVEAYYNAGISPLSFNSNIIYAIQRKNKEGRITSCDILPAITSFSSSIYNEPPIYPFIKFKRNDKMEIWGLPAKNIWDKRQPLPVKNPGLYTAQTFQKLCEIHGIKLPQPEKRNNYTGLQTVAEYKSRPLDLIIKNMLCTSNNITAELIYTIASEKYSKKYPAADTDEKVIEEFYRKNFTGIKWNNFRAVNASGLTKLNKATPEQTAGILLYMEKRNHKNFTPETILPLSGWDGTMRGRLDRPEAAFRVYAKTGNIFYATGLAGIFYAGSGKKYIFSVYINDTEKRSEYDKKNEKEITDAINAERWTKKGTASIDEFIYKMIETL